MFNIVSIKHNFILKCILITTIHLSHSCNSWFDREYLFIGFIIKIYLSWLVRSWSYEWHISFEYVVELRELIQWESFYYSSPFHSARIIFYFIERSFSSIFFFFEFFLIFHSTIVYSVFFFCTVLPVHISKLIECKYFTMLSDSSITIDNWSTWITDEYPYWDYYK